MIVIDGYTRDNKSEYVSVKRMQNIFIERYKFGKEYNITYLDYGLSNTTFIKDIDASKIKLREIHYCVTANNIQSLGFNGRFLGHYVNWATQKINEGIVIIVKESVLDNLVLWNKRRNHYKTKMTYQYINADNYVNATSQLWRNKPNSVVGALIFTQCEEYIKEYVNYIKSYPKLLKQLEQTVKEVGLKKLNYRTKVNRIRGLSKSEYLNEILTYKIDEFADSIYAWEAIIIMCCGSNITQMRTIETAKQIVDEVYYKNVISNKAYLTLCDMATAHLSYGDRNKSIILRFPKAWSIKFTINYTMEKRGSREQLEIQLIETSRMYKSQGELIRDCLCLYDTMQCLDKIEVDECDAITIKAICELKNYIKMIRPLVIQNPFIILEHAYIDLQDAYVQLINKFIEKDYGKNNMIILHMNGIEYVNGFVITGSNIIEWGEVLRSLVIKSCIFKNDQKIDASVIDKGESIVIKHDKYNFIKDKKFSNSTTPQTILYGRTDFERIMAHAFINNDELVRTSEAELFRIRIENNHDNIHYK